MTRIRDIANILSSSTSMATDAEVTSAVSAQFMAGKNSVINGNFDIWQRGTSFAGLTTYVYTADRWKVVLSGTSLNATLSQDASVPNLRSKYSAKLQQLTSSATTVGEFGFHQMFETSNILPLCGSSATLSFWYKSNMTGTHYYRIYTAFHTGGADTTSSFTVNAADTWEYKTISISAFAGITAVSTAPIANGAELQFGASVYGSSARTIAANSYVQVAQVQLEAGSNATTFSRAGGAIQGELAACQRYYQVLGDNIYELIYGGYMTSGTVGYISFPYPVTMRTTPTGTLVGGWAIYNTGQPIIQSTHPKTISLRVHSSTTGQFYFHSNTTYYLTMSAEL
jgi:hypothetical protein